MAFLAAEHGNRQLEDLPQADFGLWQIEFGLSTKMYLLSIRKKSITGFVKRKLRPLSFSVMVQRIFPHEPYLRRALRPFICGLCNL